MDTVRLMVKISRHYDVQTVAIELSISGINSTFELTGQWLAVASRERQAGGQIAIASNRCSGATFERGISSDRDVLELGGSA